MNPKFLLIAAIFISFVGLLLMRMKIDHVEKMMELEIEKFHYQLQIQSSLEKKEKTIWNWGGK